MYPILIGTTTFVSTTRPEAPLRTYARLEYGERDATWLTLAARPNGGSRKDRLARRLRDWLSTFRGFTDCDVRGVDDRNRA